MKDKVFLDTNFLVYLQNHLDPQRQMHCRRLLVSRAGDTTFCLSTQVLQEFYVVMTKKLGADPVKVKNVIQLFQQFETVLIDPGIILHAIDLAVLNQTSFWDALIISAAHKANCSTIWTEDLNHGQIISGMRIINPFSIALS